MESKDKKKLIYGLIVIFLLSCFTWWFYYINEPLNEDLSGYFFTSADGARVRIATLGQVIEIVKQTYITWSGRIPGYFLIRVSKLFPRGVQAVACALIFTLNVILTIRIVVKDTVKALASPVLFLVLYLTLYWLRPYTGVNYRWEFVAIYSFTVTLVLLYYNLAGSRFEPDEYADNAPVRKRILSLVLIQLLGIVTGMCHEILSFGLIALIGTEWIVDMIRHKAKPVSIFKHWGLALGYLIGTLAPGNLQRLNADSTLDSYSAKAIYNLRFPLVGDSSYVLASAEQAVDNTATESLTGFSAAMSGYLGRIEKSFDMHEMTIMGEGGGGRQTWVLFLIVFAIAFISMVCMLIRGQKAIVLNMIINDIGLMVSCISSVLMWAFVYWQPTYVVWLPTIFVYIAVLEFAVRLPDILVQSVNSDMVLKAGRIVRIALPAVTIITLICIYGSEVSSFAHTSMIRRERILYAQKNGLDEISIPKYDEGLSHLRYSLYALNNQEEYDSGYYTRYYGVHLVIEDR